MILYTAVCLLILAADQALKAWVAGNFELYATRPLLPGLVELQYVRNTGGGWSVLSEHTWLLTALSCLIILAVLVLLGKKIVRHPLGRWACVLLLAGGIGNQIDRFRLGYVVDMFHFQFFPTFPVFNIADMAIVCGTVLGAVYYLFFYEKYDAGRGGENHGDHPAS